MKNIIEMLCLSLLLSVALTACASMLTTPLKDCKQLCADQKVEFFKSDDTQCLCGKKELFR